MGDSGTAGHAARSILWIGEWRVDPSLNQLRRGNEVVRLEPKSMEVLVALAQHAGEVVSRDELLTIVWPGMVVCDDALTQAVIKLRKALGDAAREATYIETIAKRGYRLVASVAREAPPGEVPSPPPRGWPPVRRVLPVLAAVLAVALGAVLYLGVRGQTEVSSDGSGLQALLSGLDRMAEQPTVGVRPFEAIGEGARQAVLAAGLTSDLTTDLASIPGLTVLGGSRPVREAAPGSVALLERYVVTGSVQLAGERLRVNVQLADARAGRQLWTERIERDTADLFAVQDDILRRLLAVLPVKIDQAERERSASRYTRSPEAYELFHAGLRAMGAREQTQNESARELYWRAIALDPGFARAYAGVAMTHAQDFRQMWAPDGGAALVRAIETAEAAHRIDPANAEALWVLAFVRAHERRHGEAARLIEEALKRNPSFADSYFLKGLLLMETGNPREALTWMHAAMRLVPNPGYIHYFGFGQAYFFLKDHARARTNLQAALARNPAHAESHLYLAATEAEQGHMDKASWHVEEVRSLRPRFAGREWLERHPVVDREQRKRLEEVLARLGLRD